MSAQHTIKLNEGELAELIRASGPVKGGSYRVVDIAFGPHGVWLSQHPSSHWAHVIVAKRRGILHDH